MNTKFPKTKTVVITIFPEIVALEALLSKEDPDNPFVSNQKPRAMLNKAVMANDIDATSHFIDAVIAQEHADRRETIFFAIRRALSYGKPTILCHLLEENKASVEGIMPCSLINPDHEDKWTETWQILIDHGWDINTPQETNVMQTKDQRLLQLVIGFDEKYVRWCLSHGASLEDSPFDPLHCPPLLETAAHFGTVSIFKLLQQHGAEMPRTHGRLLHRAVQAAAAWSSRTPKEYAPKMEMVRFLVEELGVDVNKLDTEEQWAGHHGTPLNYAVQGGREIAGGGKGEEVVRYLLDKGADPRIKDAYGTDTDIDLVVMINLTYLIIFIVTHRYNKGKVFKFLTGTVILSRLRACLRNLLLLRHRLFFLNIYNASPSLMHTISNYPHPHYGPLIDSGAQLVVHKTSIPKSYTYKRVKFSSPTGFVPKALE
ncbi:MAG: hypothetical protein Q9225_000953 [Loekoesia sp. 1 TL-2023]